MGGAQGQQIGGGQVQLIGGAQNWSTINTKNLGGAWGGADIPGGYTGNSSISACQNACAARSDCYTAAFTSQGNGCYLKGKLSSSNWSSAYAGQDWTFMAKPGSTLPSITADSVQNQAAEPSVNGYSLQKNIDHPNSAVVGNTTSKDPVVCSQACNANPQCTGFIQSTDNPYCWLTSSMTAGQPSLVRNTYTLQGTNPALVAQQAAAKQAAELAAKQAADAAAAQAAAQQAQQVAAQQAAAARDAQAAAQAAAAKKAADEAAVKAAQQAADAQVAQQAAAAQAAAAKAPAPSPMAFAPSPMAFSPAPMGSSAPLAHSPVPKAPKYEHVTPKQTEHCLETLRKCVAAAPDGGSAAPAPSTGTSHYQAYGGAPFGEPASTGSNIMKIFLAFLVVMFAMLMAAKQ